MKKKLFFCITKNYFSDYLTNSLTKANSLKDFDMEFIYVNSRSKIRRVITNFVLISFSDIFEICINILKKFGNNRVELQLTKNINDQSFIDYINSKKPYLLVSLLCNQIFKKETLDDINCEVVNFHPGILPNYRGLYPNFYSIINNENYIGITYHQINEKIDDGKIYSIKKYKLNSKSKIFKTYKKLFFNVETIKFIEKSLINHKNAKKKLDGKGSKKLDKGRYYSYPSLRQILKYKFS